MRFNVCFSIFIIILYSCNNTKTSPAEKLDPGFTNYVSAFTSGLIESDSSIKIILNEASQYAKKGGTLAEDVLKFSPKIDGQAVWVDHKTIAFRPYGKFKSGTTYNVAFELSKLFNVEKNLNTMEFSFNVIKQSMFVTIDGLKSSSESSKQLLYGVIKTNDKTENSKIERCITAKQNSKDLKITWTHNSNQKSHSFVINNITRRAKESYVDVAWNGKYIGADIKNNKSIRVPPLGEFTLLQVSTYREPGLHFNIQLSDPINTNQDLNGLVYLKSGKKLTLKLDNNEIKAYPTEKLNSVETVIVSNAIKNTKGNQLQKSYERDVEFNLTYPAVELIGNGVIMPSSGNITFPFKAVNLKAINLRIIKIFEDNIPQFMQQNQLDGYRDLTRVGKLIYDDTIDLVSEEPIDYGEWNNFSIDLSSIIEPELGAIYRVMIAYERYQSLYPCSKTDNLVKPLKKKALNFADNVSYFSPNSWYEGGYNYSEKDNPCSDSYYKYYNRAISANIISSNIGLLAKSNGDAHLNILATDLRTSTPINGLKVKALNFQNRNVGEGVTNKDGLVNIKTSEKPYLIVANDKNQKGYLRVDNGSSLSVSMFEVGGTEIKQGIKGFIYGERGVWRPGDTIHLSFMLEDKLNKLPKTHPVVMELYDPLGKLYDKKVTSLHKEGLYYFKLNTLPNDITGVWRAKVMVGNSTFYKPLKIETIKPNRLKINFDFDKVQASNKPINSILEAKWLYGSPGSNLKTRVECSLSNLKTTFENFESYQFDDRSRRFSGSNTIFSDGTTNAAGKVDHKFNVKKPNNVPGMLKLKFRSKVFENGGDYSEDFTSTRYSPYRSYVGIKVNGGENWMNALNTEKTHPIALAAVSEFGTLLSKEVNIKIYKLGWRWWWEGNSSDELTQYISSYDKKLIQNDTYRITNGKGTYNLKFDKPAWGRLLIEIEDPSSGHKTSQLIYADYPGWWSNDSSGSKAASMLSIETGKSNYNVGEDIEVVVPSGGIGNLFVTVEKGNRILEQFWVKAEEKSTTFRIRASKEMTPNIYITATLIQPHAQTKNSLPIRVYGVVPVLINDINSQLKPIVKGPKSVKPESTFNIKVSEENKSPMAYSLAVVDEGLLSLTRYKTPNPWETFNAKEALKVKTWDLYNYVMNAKTGKMVPLLGVGGDETLSLDDNSEVKRFKPVVKYLGPFYLKAGKENTHKIQIPNYIGAVRVMLVAGYNGSYGATEREIIVKQPVMVNATLPRVLGPSEKILVPVNVITTEDKKQDVRVSLKTNSLLKILGNKTQNVSFSGAGEKTIYFELEVAKQLGKAQIDVKANSGQDKAYETIEIAVRAPNPHISKTQSKVLEANKNWEVNYKAIGITGSNSTKLTVSKIPNLDLQKQLDYLIKYPHGCIEQTTSSVFPQLKLGDLTDLSDVQQQSIDTNIKEALKRLRKFQLTNGGMSYWPGNQSQVSEWGTNYAGHFMIEAQQNGYKLPVGLLEQWLKYQKQAASNWNRTRYNEWGRYGGDLVQSYRLFTLALSGHADVGAMNRLKSDPKLSNTSAWRLAAAYALIGREDAALSLTKTAINIEPYKETGFTYGSELRDLAMILETLVYMKDFNRGAPLVKDIAKTLRAGWHSTQTRAYALLAISKFTGPQQQSAPLDLNVTINSKDYSINTNKSVYSIEVPEQELQKGSIAITNMTNQIIFVDISQMGTPVEISESPIRSDLDMTITYENLKGYPIDISKVKQGEDFKALVKIKHPGLRPDLKALALNQIFPSGWQIINSRLFEAETSGKSFNYKDIKDDRIYTYFDLNKSKSVSFEVRLNATFCGTFYKPGIYCAPMYDESIQALEPGQWVKVVPKDN